jgi:hypothetical protein
MFQLPDLASSTLYGGQGNIAGNRKERGSTLCQMRSATMDKASKDSTKEKNQVMNDLIEEPSDPIFDDNSEWVEQLRKIAIRYFKEHLIIESFQNGTSQLIVTNGLKTYTIPGIIKFTPNWDERIFKITMRTNIDTKLFPRLKKIKRIRINNINQGTLKS